MYDEFVAIGTSWRIEIGQEVTLPTWSYLLKEIHERIEVFDQTYSRFRPDSFITQLFERPSTYPMPADGVKLFTFYHQLYLATDKKVTPLIGNLVSDAGYDATYRLTSKPVQHPPAWEGTLTYDESTITLNAPVILDVGAAGKGYLVDIIGAIIESYNISSFLINAGGDILYQSGEGKVLSVGLENPFDTSEAIGIAHLSGGSLCASAVSKRMWSGWHHIIDPIELRSPEHIAATWVIAENAMTADGLATALFFQDAARLQKYFTFSYALLDNQMNLTYSPDFPIEVFTRHT